jgi:putative acetyltransferase
VTVDIVPLNEHHFEALRDALDTVAREKRFLAFQAAPPREDAFAFYRNILANGHPMFVAIVDGTVAGWCDVLPTHGESRAHVGILGIGLVRAARHRGLGAALMRTTIDAAWRKGLTRIELSVRADNANAKALYERMGFVVEGLSRNAFRVDGAYHDSYVMGLVRA